MQFVAYIVFGFAVIQFLIALVNLIFRQKLPDPDPEFQPLISVMIPARNEDQNIGKLLNDLQVQPYKNIEVLVFNDQSEDRTAAVAEGFALSDKRISLYHSEGLPDGWLGKNYGCFSLAQKAKGKYFLFLDADVRISGNVIAKAMNKVRKHRLGLLTIFPKQDMKSWGEYLVVPSMNYILLSLLPLVLVRLTKLSSLSAANGQFMLFDAETYKQQQPHEKQKMKRVEDIQIARSFKQLGISIACLAATSNVQCRMYTGYNDAAHGLSRSIIMFFGNSITMTVLFWVLTTTGFLIVLLALPLAAFVFYVLVMVFTRIFISAISHQNTFKNLLLGFFQKWIMAHVIFLAIRSQIKNAYEWKGRKVA